MISKLNHLSCIILLMCVSGCAINSGIVKVGDNIYTLSRKDSVFSLSSGNLQTNLLQEASQFCEQQGKKVKVISTDVSKTAGGDLVVVKFMCVDANELELKKTQSKKPLEQNNVRSSNIKNIAISSFDAREMSSADAVTIADFIRTDIVRIGNLTVMDRNNMEMILAEQKFQLSGCTTKECVVKLGKVLNVQGVVVGSISKLMGQIVISVSLVNVETGKVEFSCDYKANNFDEIRDACKKIADEMSN